MTEKQLIQDCIDNSRKAQCELFYLYYQDMISLCVYYCKNNEDARWIVNQGFMDVFTHIRSFQFKSSLKTWIKRIMINRAINFYRQEKAYRSRQNLMEYDELIAMENQSPDADALEKMLAGEVVELIQSLPFNERTVFTLYVIEGYSHKEIGEILGFADGTSRWYLNSSKKLLKKKLNPETKLAYEK